MDKVPLRNYKIHFKSGTEVSFIGEYQPLLESDNWHYWEREHGEMIHVRKDKIEFIEGGLKKDIELVNEIKLNNVIKNYGSRSIWGRRNKKD